MKQGNNFTKNKIPLTIRIMGITSLAVALAAAVLLALYYSKIPDSIPTHYGVNRSADGWGAKAFLWYIVVGNILLNILLSGIIRLPIKGINPSWGKQANSACVNRATAGLLAITRLFISLIFASTAAVMALSVEKYPVSLTILNTLLPIVCFAYGIRLVILTNKEAIKK